MRCCKALWATTNWALSLCLSSHCGCEPGVILFSSRVFALLVDWLASLARYSANGPSLMVVNEYIVSMEFVVILVLLLHLHSIRCLLQHLLLPPVVEQRCNNCRVLFLHYFPSIYFTQQG